MTMKLITAGILSGGLGFAGSYSAVHGDWAIMALAIGLYAMWVNLLFNMADK